MKFLVVLVICLVGSVASATELRLHVLYSDRAMEDMSLAELDKQFDESVRAANQIFLSSGIDITLTVAQRDSLSEMIPDMPLSDEGGDYAIYLMSQNMVLQPMDAEGVYTGVPVDLGADLIVTVLSDRAVVERSGELSACGNATGITEERYFTVPMNETSFRGYAAITNGAGARCNVETLAHELGHSMGSGHLKGGLPFGIYPDAYGAACGGSNTLMSSNYPRINQISDPEFTYNNEPCGDVDNANNKRVFALTAPMVATRLTPEEWVYSGELFLDASQASIPEGGEVELLITREGDLSSPSSVELMVLPESGAAMEDLVGAVDSTLVEFAANEASKTIALTAAQNEVTGSTKTFEFFLMNGGQFSVAEQSLTLSITDDDASSGGTGGGGGGEVPQSSSGGGSMGFATLLLGCLFLRRKGK